MRNVDEDPELLRLLGIALQQRDEGNAPNLETLCGDRPDLRDVLAKALGLASNLPGLQDDLATHDPMLGRVLAERYELLARIGSGAMGVVYEALDRDLQRRVAIKLLREDLLSGPEAAARFEREAETLAAVQHESVVTVFDRGSTAEGERYLVMELLRGSTLDDLLGQARRDGRRQLPVATDWLADELGAQAITESNALRQLVRWILEVAEGLAVTHAAGIYHRDLKPSNVFVRRDGGATLIDFGLVALDASATLRSRSEALGTPAYMAPEQFDPETPTEAGVDVYGLAATLYHAVTLAVPYPGTPAQVFASLHRRDPVRATRLNPSLPRDLQAILDRGLARNRSQRYATIAEFAADLRAFLDHQPVRARPLTLAQRTWRRARRSPAFRVGVLVAAAAVLTAGSFDAYASWQQQRQTEAARAWGRIPPTLTLEHPNNRLVADLQARGAIAQQLDEAVAASVEPVPARLVRAAFRLDHGDPAGAAADMAEVAQQLDSDYGRSLANRYASLPATADSIGDLDLGGLPAPTSATGQFIDAFHALRRRSSRDDFAKAQRLLASPELADYPPAVEIALQIQLDSAGRERDRALRLTAFRQLHDAAVRLETARGASAMTAHLCAAALAGQERYQEAAVEVLRGLEYSPHAHGLHVNAGTIFRRLAQLTRAGKHLQRVIDLRPQTLNAYQTLIWVHLENRAFAAAQELIDQAPWPDSRAGLRRQRQLQGHLEHEQALALWTAGQPDAAREAARRAIATFEEAQELGFPGGTFEVAVCRGLLDGSGEAVTALLESLTTEPVNWRRIAAVQALLPESLDADQTLALGQYLQALRRHLAPGEPRQTPAPPQPSRAR